MSDTLALIIGGAMLAFKIAVVWLFDYRLRRKQ